MEDSVIIDLYWAREERALSETDTKYGGYCRSIAHNILRNREDTEECVSDTWLHAWNAMPPQRPSILSSFLGRITRNLSFDRCRRQNAEKRGGGSLPLALDELSECVPAPGRVEQALEARRIVRRGDDEDVADAREHERRERVVDHGLVVHGQQLLGRDPRERVQPRAGTPGEDDAFHRAASLQSLR